MPEPIEISFLLRDPQALNNLLISAAQRAGQMKANTAQAGDAAAKALPHYLRLQAAVAKLSGGSALSPNQAAGAIIQAQRAQAQIQRIQQASNGGNPIRSALGDLAWRNRFVNTAASGAAGSLSGGARGVADYILTMVGSMGAYGKAAELAARAVEAAATAVYNFADQAAKAANQFATIRASLLSTSTESGQINSLGGAGGFDATAMAKAFHYRITSDPVAAGAAGSLGVQGVGGPFGTRDLATNFIAALKGIRQIQNREEQLLALRRLGIEQAEPLTRLSNRTFNAITGGDARISGLVNDDAHQANAAELTAAQSRLKGAQENLSAALSDPAIDAFAEIMNAAATGINLLAEWSKKHQAGIETFLTNALAIIPGGGAAIAALHGAKALNEEAGGANGTGDALDKQATALDKNTQALNRMGDMWGGGERSQNALPRAGRTSEMIRSGSIANLPAI